MEIPYEELIVKLNNNFFNKNPNDIKPKFEDKIQIEKKVNIISKLLIPCQSEIDKVLSLKPLLKGKNNNLKNIFNNIPTIIAGEPVLVYKCNNEYYIMDGHHRWVELFLLNPDCPIICDMITIPSQKDSKEKLTTPLEMLLAIQTAIYSIINTIPTSNVNGDNLFKINQNDFEEYIIETSNDEFKDQLNFLGKTVETLANDMWKNLCNINKPIKGAPKRGLMPQVTGNSKTSKEDKTKLKRLGLTPLIQGKVPLKMNYIKKFNEFKNYKLKAKQIKS